ncbi:hypothetical protein SAMN05421730_1003104 [Anaerobium acetethylicum]|uniref:Uncharacterized protein n=1 Tax=Anaerobium acetethylicum TaxID=1619234 RepID=A0A1D3TQV0_9FIRM|nr:hypothetical protein SAMN05421730_1003104 [Anaerobium acetethylicum]
MKTLALGPRILRPYVPLRLHLSESALRMNMFCITSAFTKPVQIDEYNFVNGLLTLYRIVFGLFARLGFETFCFDF